MGSSSYSIVTVVLFLLLGASCSIVVAFDGTLLSRICNGDQFKPVGAYGDTFEDVIDDLTWHTSKSSQMDYYCHHTNHDYFFGQGDVTFYGHGVCTENLNPNDCQDCVNYAHEEMYKECTHSMGAQIQLMDCRLRYETYEFNNDG